VYRYYYIIGYYSAIKYILHISTYSENKQNERHSVPVVVGSSDNYRRRESRNLPSQGTKTPALFKKYAFSEVVDSGSALPNVLYGRPEWRLFSCLLPFITQRSGHKPTGLCYAEWRKK